MGNMLVRDMPPVLEDAVREYSRDHSVSISEAAKSLMRSGVVANRNDLFAGKKAETKPGDQLVQIFQGVFQSDEEHAEFERSLRDFRRAPDRAPLDFE